MDYLATPSTSELPSYSPSSPSPSYTCQLGSGERLLEHTPQSRTSRHPTSLFVKKAGRTTVILNDQEDGATMPSYGRSATISGNLFLEQSESIVEVVLKVCRVFVASMTRVERFFLGQGKIGHDHVRGRWHVHQAH